MAGKLDAITRLYDDYARTLVVFFQRRVEDPETAIEMTSETFAIATERFDQFRGESDRELSGWLWSIARTVLAEHERHSEVVARRSQGIGIERRALADAEIERIEELAASEDQRREIARRLEILPTDQREAVRLRVVEDLPYEEVAARLEISVSGARSRVERGLRRLRHLVRFNSADEGAGR